MGFHVPQDRDEQDRDFFDDSWMRLSSSWHDDRRFVESADQVLAGTGQAEANPPAAKVEKFEATQKARFVAPEQAGKEEEEARTRLPRQPVFGEILLMVFRTNPAFATVAILFAGLLLSAVILRLISLFL